VIRRAREMGARRIEALDFAGGVKVGDARDLRWLVARLPATDVVHVHRGKEHWLAALANRMSRTPRPLVRTRHIVQPVRPHALNRWLYRRATGLVVTVTGAIRAQYIAGGLLPPERVVALPGGVDAARFEPVRDGAEGRRALGAEPGVPLIGVVSGLRVMKGHLIAVQAARMLAAAGRSFRLAFIGQGALEAPIRRAVAEVGLEDRIGIAGFVDDVAEIMAALDLALYPALESDGMSRVLFEYLASARPIVASRIGVVPEVLEDGKTALLVPAGEAEALASAVARLLDDRGLRDEIGAAGARLAHGRLSAAHVAAELERLYGRLGPSGPP